MSSSRKPRSPRIPVEAIESQKNRAIRAYEAVRVAVQAIRHRKAPTGSISVESVSVESGVPMSTIYRRNELFAMVQKLNPNVQRRQAGDLFRRLEEAQARTDKAVADADYFRQQASLSKLGDRGIQQENAQLRKKLVDMERENQRLRQMIERCTCGSNRLKVVSLDPGGNDPG